MTVTVIDANVFLHKWTRNTLLWVAKEGLFDPAWSKRILRETYANMALKDLGTAKDIRYLHGQLKKNFADAWYDENDIDDLIPEATNDRKDRHVLAAAILADAATIVTYNGKDFPSKALKPHSVVACLPDAYLARLAAKAPDIVADALERQRKATVRPHPWTMEELIGKLAQPEQLPNFAAAMASHMSITPTTPP
ncbi:MAG: PIN domain-containing protein [Patulibacter sp.]|nr:PIN domain-containing protein [Patulibacter sp.]